MSISKVADQLFNEGNHFSSNSGGHDESCTGLVNALGDLIMLNARDTTFALVSRSPLEKLERYKAKQGWSLPWASSFGSAFNYDFHISLDSSITLVHYNYRNKEELKGEFLNRYWLAKNKLFDKQGAKQ